MIARIVRLLNSFSARTAGVVQRRHLGRRQTNNENLAEFDPVIVMHDEGDGGAVDDPGRSGNNNRNDDDVRYYRLRYLRLTEKKKLKRAFSLHRIVSWLRIQFPAATALVAAVSVVLFLRS